MAWLEVWFCVWGGGGEIGFDTFSGRGGREQTINEKNPALRKCIYAAKMMPSPQIVPPDEVSLADRPSV